MPDMLARPLAGEPRGLNAASGGRADYVAIVVLVAAIFLTYSSAVWSAYLFTDDYLFGENFDRTFFTNSGRALQGWAFQLLPSPTGDLTIYRPFRAVAAAALAGLCGLMYWHLRSWNADRRLNLAAALLLAALPSSQILVGWLTCWTNLPAALASACAATLTLNAFLRPWRRWRHWACLAVALALHVAALFVYQPAAMWFWVPVLFPLLSDKYLTDSRRRHAVWAGMLWGLVGVGCFFVFFKLQMSLSGVQPSARTALATNWCQKLSFFLEYPLVRGLGLWEIYHGKGVAGAIALTIGWGALASARRLSRATAARGADIAAARRLMLEKGVLVAGILALSYLPCLATAENWPSFRSLTALTAVVLLLWFWSVLQIASLVFPTDRARRYWPAGLGLFAFAALAYAAWNMQAQIVRPQRMEYQFLASRLAAGLHPGVIRVHLVQPDDKEAICRRWKSDEFGITSSARDFAALPMLRMALRGLGREETDFGLSYGKADEATPSGPDALIVDMRELRFLR